MIYAIIRRGVFCVHVPIDCNNLNNDGLELTTWVCGGSGGSQLSLRSLEDSQKLKYFIRTVKLMQLTLIEQSNIQGNITGILCRE